MMIKNYNKILIKNHFKQPKLKKDFSRISLIKKPFNNTFPITNTKNYLNKSCINFSKTVYQNNVLKNKLKKNDLPTRFLPLIRKKQKMILPNLLKNTDKFNKIYKEINLVEKQLNNIKKNNSIALKNNFSLIRYQENLINVFSKGHANAFQDGIIDKIRKNFRKINNIYMDKSKTHYDVFVESFHFPKELKDRLILKREKKRNSSSYI
jgi:hypothetical protein